MILNRQRRIAVSLAGLERYWRQVRRMLGLPAGSVTVCLVSDARIARWNRAYRRKPGPTDVLSFPAADPGANGRGPEPNRRSAPKTGEVLAANPAARKRPTAAPRLALGAEGGTRTFTGDRREAPGESSYLGDIAIAPAVALRNARRLGRELDRELRILILHGTLHLAGYDHETDSGEMERLERRLRRRLGLE